MSNEQSNQTDRSELENQIIIIKTDKENIITVKEMYHDVIKEQLVLGVSVEAPNGDWYEKDQNFDVDKWGKLPGCHINKWKKDSNHYEILDITTREFYKKIPEIWCLTSRRDSN